MLMFISTKERLKRIALKIFNKEYQELSRTNKDIVFKQFLQDQRIIIKK